MCLVFVCKNVCTYVCMLYVCMYVCRSTGTQSSTKGFGGKYSLRINIGPHEVMRDSTSLSIVHYCMYVCMYVCMYDVINYLLLMYAYDYVSVY